MGTFPSFLVFKPANGPYRDMQILFGIPLPLRWRILFYILLNVFCYFICCFFYSCIWTWPLNDPHIVFNAFCSFLLLLKTGRKQSLPKRQAQRREVSC